MIKLGLYSSIENPPHGDDMDRCVQETLAEAEFAEACGFHGFFFGEHHQNQDGFLPSPLVVCSAVAARTKKIQIGTFVLLLLPHHPLRIAEADPTTQSANLDRRAGPGDIGARRTAWRRGGHEPELALVGIGGGHLSQGSTGGWE